MPNLPISQLPESLSGSPDSLMVIVNYDIVPSGVTYSIPFSALTSQFNPGLFTQTGNSPTVSATTTESSIIDGGVGSISIPANGFSVGDTFMVVIAGTFSADNNEGLRLRVKAGSTVLADSGASTVPGASDDVFKITLYFTVRQIGGAGTASIVTVGDFAYLKESNNLFEGFAFNTVNDTTFDTTTSNTLDVTVEWATSSTGNSIYSDIFTLRKLY